MPYRRVFDVVWSGRRNLIMMASQIDRSGNQNISAIGDWARPKAQLVGVRGAPGNTVNHSTSYWVPNHIDAVVRRPGGRGLRRGVPAGGGGRPGGQPVPRDPPGGLQSRGLRLRDARPGDAHPVGAPRGRPSRRSTEATGFELVVPTDVPDDPHAHPGGARV